MYWDTTKLCPYEAGRQVEIFTGRLHLGLGFSVQGLGFRVEGFGLSVQGTGLFDRR